MPTAFHQKLAKVAMGEFNEYHGFEETDAHLAKEIKAYWVDLGMHFPGVATPWSAVFVSWCVKQAGAGPEDFKFADSHSEFVYAAIQNAQKGTGRFKAFAPSKYAPQLGDIIQNNRGVNQFNFAHATEHPHYESHSAIVTEVVNTGGERYVTTVGGNESQSVRTSRVNLDANGFIDNKSKRYISVLTIDL
jgi:hypothetical protein